MGLGLRSPHSADIARFDHGVPWFEAISENFMPAFGTKRDTAAEGDADAAGATRSRRFLERVRAEVPIALHGVSLSIGTKAPLDAPYLDRLRILIHAMEPAIVSDHLSWSFADGENLHDLLPLPFTEEALDVVSERVLAVQERLGRTISLENVSSYLTYAHSTMPEWEFLTAVAERTGCGILLDLNNVYVNSRNHGYSSEDFLRGIPATRIAQYHLGGHSVASDGLLIDTHDHAVSDPVWELFRMARALHGPDVPVLIEWDGKIPEFSVLRAEALRAEGISVRDPPEPEPGSRSAYSAPNSAPIRIGTTAPALAELQTRLRTWITDARGLARAAPALDASVRRRLDVYAEGYFARLRDVLAEDFPRSSRMLGPLDFSVLVARYLVRHPSRTPNVAEVGEWLPEFYRESEPSRDERIVESLEIEREILRARHRPVARTLTVRRSRYPLDRWWRDEIDLSTGEQERNYVVFQSALGAISITAVRTWEAELLIQLENGKSIEEALESLSGEFEPELNAVNWSAHFAHWINLDWIPKVS